MIDGPCIISTDTLRSEDLIPAFLGALELLPGTERTVERIRREYADLLRWFEEEREGFFDHIPEQLQEDASYLINEELFNLLNEYGPEGTYFGSSEGDGACFGFWEYEEVDG